MTERHMQNNELVNKILREFAQSGLIDAVPLGQDGITAHVEMELFIERIRRIKLPFRLDFLRKLLEDEIANV
jgi:hypothetical protein